MGGICCGSRGNYEMGIDIERNKPEITKIKQIEKFNWNEENSYGCTIEEIIMTSLANDLGDLINPQTTHILFSEFKKLMFLNAMNLKTLEEEKLAEGKPYHKKELKKNVFIGLVAPPILDLVWCILIRTKIYEKFCAQTFKGFLDRHPPTAKIDERKIYDYPVTIKLITNYGALLNPFKNVWPHYDKESMLFDAKCYVTVDSNDLTRIIESAKKKCKTISKSVEDWKKSVQEVSDEHSKANIHKEEKVSAYSSEKIKFENKDKTIKALFSEIELRDSKSNVTKQKLQDKYMINVDTSKAWIKEYYKFIIMLIKDEGAYLPSWKVQAVLNTHAENSEAFRHFSFDLFGKLIYPEDYNIHINDTVEAKNKYKNTLNEYKSLYGASPNSALWEPVYSRFACVDEENEGEEGKRSQETDKSSSITFSILRYIAVNQSIAAKNDPFDVNKFSNPTKDDNDTYITDTIKNQKERDSEAKKNSLYYWRSAYPHCSNVYAGTKIKGKGVDYFPNPHEESKLKQNVFNNGGVAFLINPLAESDLKSDNYPDTLFKNFYSSAKLEVAKDISLDDLADAAFRNAYLQTSLKTEAAKS